MARDPGPTSRAAWRLLALLTFLNVLNFVDRTLIASLAPLLIADLGLSRADIGLLVGYGFVLFYTLAALGLGLVADRWPRVPLVAGGLELWSAMPALSGTARSFVHLALPRLLVGVGEATLTPSALSMLADRFPARRLATASGIYYAGVPLGTAVSLIASGQLFAEHVHRHFRLVDAKGEHDLGAIPHRPTVVLCLRDFVAAAREGRSSAVTVDDGLAAVRVADAVRCAAIEGRRVPLA